MSKLKEECVSLLEVVGDTIYIALRCEDCKGEGAERTPHDTGEGETCASCSGRGMTEIYLTVPQLLSMLEAAKEPKPAAAQEPRYRSAFGYDYCAATDFLNDPANAAYRMVKFDRDFKGYLVVMERKDQ